MHSASCREDERTRNNESRQQGKRSEEVKMWRKTVAAAAAAAAVAVGEGQQGAGAGAGAAGGVGARRALTLCDGPFPLPRKQSEP
eukprot:753097-Hanusia_phi.AAC.2